MFCKKNSKIVFSLSKSFIQYNKKEYQESSQELSNNVSSNKSKLYIFA